MRVGAPRGRSVLTRGRTSAGLIVEEATVMNYGYGPAMTNWPYTFPNWSQGAYGGLYGAYGAPFTTFSPATGYGLGAGYGTFPFSAAYTYPPFGAPPANDDEIRYFVEQALDNDPTIPSHTHIDVQVNDAVVTLTGTVPNKRIKHAAGDDAWWVPQVFDVHNEINIVSRRERAGATGEGGQPSQRESTAGSRRATSSGR